jgi:serine/threonine protein kinase
LNNLDFYLLGTGNIEMSTHQFDEWDKLEFIEKNANALVFKWNPQGYEMAVRMIYNSLPLGFKKQLGGEALVCTNLRFHPNIVQHYHTIFSRPPMSFITNLASQKIVTQDELELFCHTPEVSKQLQLLLVEYFSGGTVKDFLKVCSDGPTLLRICCEVADVVRFLYQQRIIHRDVKSDNLLISACGVVALCDFGESMKFDNDSMTKELASSSIGGNSVHLAPEVVDAVQKRKKVSYKYQPSWELGVLFLEVALKVELLATITNEQRNLDFLRNRMRELQEASPSMNYPEEFLQLITGCLSVPPLERPTLDQICTVLHRISSDTMLVEIAPTSKLPNLSTSAKRKSFWK